jgi:excisionase family DNA binding protein
MNTGDTFGVFLREMIKPILSEIIDEKLREHLPPVKPESDDNRFITRNEAAKLLGVNLVTLDKICKQGALQKHRNGSLVRLKKSEVLEVFQTFEKRKRHQFDNIKK